MPGNGWAAQHPLNSTVWLVRIAIVHPDLSSGKGVESYTLELARSLATEHEVHVFANRWEALPANVRLHKVWAMPGPYFLRLLTFAVNVTRQLRRQSFDLVNVQGCCALAGDVVTAHSCHRSYWQLPRKLPARLRKWLNPFHYVALGLSDRLFTSRHTRWVIALSQGNEQDICDVYGFPPRRILVRTPGVDRDKFHPANRVRYRHEVRAEFALREDDFVLLFAGNEFHRKGLDLVLQAMARISQPRLKLLVAGATQPAVQWQYRRLARKLGVQVRFAGRQRNMDRIYAAADVFVLPSRYEAFPAVVLEAAASGLPLLVSRTDGIRDVLIHDRNGWYVERDPADIAARITALMDHPQQLLRVGMAARASTEDFDAKRARASLLATYTSLAKNGLPSTAQTSQEYEPQQPEQPHALF